MVSCVHANDMMPRASFGHLNDLIDSIVEWERRDKQDIHPQSSDIFGIWTQPLSDTDLAQVYLNIKSNLNNQKLVAPGKIF